MKTQLTLHNITVFQSANLQFSNQINCILGENNTGKSHLLKLLYSLIQPSIQNQFQHIPEKLKNTF